MSALSKLALRVMFVAYGANYDRLVKIKTAYDPTNFFRHNQNIRPMASTGVAS
jgi:FAD/FMN-containing dehydrogenase